MSCVRHALLKDAKKKLQTQIAKGLRGLTGNFARPRQLLEKSVPRLMKWKSRPGSERGESDFRFLSRQNSKTRAWLCWLLITPCAPAVKGAQCRCQSRFRVLSGNTAKKQNTENRKENISIDEEIWIERWKLRIVPKKIYLTCSTRRKIN